MPTGSLTAEKQLTPAKLMPAIQIPEPILVRFDSLRPPFRVPPLIPASTSVRRDTRSCPLVLVFRVFAGLLPIQVMQRFVCAVLWPGHWPPFRQDPVLPEAQLFLDVPEFQVSPE